MRYWIFSWVIVSLILLNGCAKSLPKEEARKQLKAFDNEFIVVYDQLAKCESSKILKQLLAVKDLPVPLINLLQTNAIDQTKFDFGQRKGVYKVDSENNVERIALSDSIIVIFSYPSKNDSVAYLELTEFSEDMTKWGSAFPTNLMLKVKASGIVLFEINMKGEVKHTIPTKMDLMLKMDQYIVHVKLRSLLNKRKIRFYVNMDLSSLEDKLISADLKLKYNVSNPDQSILETTKVNINSFPIDLFIAVDNKLFNPAATNFIDEFNKCSTIKIMSQLDGNSIGEVKLAQRNGGEKLNYLITYSDETSEFFEDFLLSYKHIMNARFPEFLVD